MNTDNRYHWSHKDLLDVTQLSRADTLHLLDLAASFQEINSRPVKKVPTLKGKTVVVITHRTSVLAAVDRLLVMRDGTVLVSGTANTRSGTAAR